MTKKNNRHLLSESPLFKVRRRKDLARILNATEAELKKLCDQSLYSVKDIVTPKGKTRHTETPVKSLRRIHERLARLLSDIEPPEFLYCPVKGRSYVDNAAQHKDSRIIWTMDVRNFFPSTPSSKVFWFFNHTMDCAPDVSGVLTKIATKDGRLPTGSPLSPIMAFYAFFEMWNKIAKIATDAGCIVTVYMDDMTVSGPEVSSDTTWAIKQTIFNSGLRYHKEKLFADRAALITGVIIRDGKLLLPNKQHQKAHQARSQISVAGNPEEAMASSRRLAGLMSQRSQVREKNKAA